MPKHIRLLVGAIGLLSFASCYPTKNTEVSRSLKVQKVNSAHFLANEHALSIETIDCTLSNGQKSKCLQIITKGIPTDHDVGPWCPETITDHKSEGGLWFDNGKLHSVDGEFIHNLAVFYDDKHWLLYDEDGHVIRTNSKEDCLELANARLVDEFTNYCIECLPEYVADLDKTIVIPLQPELLDSPTSLGGPPRDGPTGGGSRPNRPPQQRDGDRRGGGGGGGPVSRGIAFNGVTYDAPAPIQLILSGYTIPPLDHAGGHINMNSGYHYHAATGHSKEISQTDGHAPMIGYAMDGIGLYAYKDKNGQAPEDLDQCRGHYDDVRGYHYHVDDAGENNFINCFSGATAKAD